MTIETTYDEQCQWWRARATFPCPLNQYNKTRAAEDASYGLYAAFGTGATPEHAVNTLMHFLTGFGEYTTVQAKQPPFTLRTLYLTNAEDGTQCWYTEIRVGKRYSFATGETPEESVTRMFEDLLRTYSSHDAYSMHQEYDLRSTFNLGSKE